MHAHALHARPTRGIGQCSSRCGLASFAHARSTIISAKIWPRTNFRWLRDVVEINIFCIFRNPLIGQQAFKSTCLLCYCIRTFKQLLLRNVKIIFYFNKFNNINMLIWHQLYFQYVQVLHFCILHILLMLLIYIFAFC